MLDVRGSDGKLREGAGRSSGVWGTARRSAEFVRHDDVGLRKPHRAWQTCRTLIDCLSILPLLLRRQGRGHLRVAFTYPAHPEETMLTWLCR